MVIVGTRRQGVFSEKTPQLLTNLTLEQVFAALSYNEHEEEINEYKYIQRSLSVPHKPNPVLRLASRRLCCT